MTKVVRTTDNQEIIHDKCGKPIVKIIGGVLHVECLRKGCGSEWVPLEGWFEVNQAYELLRFLFSGHITPMDSLTLIDPVAKYRHIENLVILGPAEIEMAFLGVDGANPLNLPAFWCPRIPVPWTVDQMEELSALCKTEEWATKPILWLALPEIKGEPTTLANQYGWWGQEEIKDHFYGDVGPGKINPFQLPHLGYLRKEFKLRTSTAADTVEWRIGYEFPKWAYNLGWKEQWEVALHRGVKVSRLTSESMMMSLYFAVSGKKLRYDHFVRTYDDDSSHHLCIGFLEQGLFAGLRYGPQSLPGYSLSSPLGIRIDDYDRRENIGCAVEGYPQPRTW